MPPAVPAPVPAGAPAFSPGGVIGRSFSVWVRNLVPFSLLLLALHLPNLLVTLAAGPPPGPGGAAGTYGAFTFGNAILSGLLGIVATGGITFGVLRSLDGRRSGAGALLGFGFRKIWPVFVVSLNASVRIFLWSMLFVVPGIVALCGLFVAVPARVAEPNLDSGEALEKSRALTRGHRLSIFLVVVVFWIVNVGTTVVVAALGVRSVLPFTLYAVLLWALSGIVGALWATAAGVAYHDLRVDKEGVDTAKLAAVFE